MLSGNHGKRNWKLSRAGLSERYSEGERGRERGVVVEGVKVHVMSSNRFRGIAGMFDVFAGAF